MPLSALEKLQNQVNSTVAQILGDYQPRRIRSNKVIRDTAFGFNVYYPHEINILDSPLLQRLRSIRQTSLAYYTYPSAVHSRFEHSLGATVIVARMIEALKARKLTHLDDHAVCETRLAALLHDSGHGPFSHGTELIFQSYKEIIDVQKEVPQLKSNAAHEILSYLIVNSKKFSELWRNITSLYDPIPHDYPCNLADIEPKTIARMIIGEHPKPELRYLSQMINGPHDADKFDYITRDGYFTGLTTAIDIDRFFLSLSITRKDNRSKEVSMCVDVSGVTALEQLLFNKMQLFASVYHHHKVRSAFQALQSLFNIYKKKKLRTYKGLTFNRVVDFLMVDEQDILGTTHDNDEFARAVDALKNRKLPMRALVLCSDSVQTEISRARLSRMTKDPSKVQKLRRDIAVKAKQQIADVFVDFPEEPRFHGTAFDSLVKTTPENVVNLNSIFPIAGWVKGHATHRYRVYVFSRSGTEEVVAKAAYEVLQRDEYGIKVNSMAFFLANHTTNFISSLGLIKK